MMENGGKLPLSRYKYLLTMARRKGIEEIQAYILIANEKNIAVLENGSTLPRCNISGEIDARDMEKEIRNAVEKQGLDFSCVRKYLGNVDSRCFYFEVLVKNRNCSNINCSNMRWIGKSDVSRLVIPKEEKRVLRAYFDRR